MIVPVHATNCICYLLYVNGNAKEVGSVIKRYSVRIREGFHPQQLGNSLKVALIRPPLKTGNIR